MKDEEIELNEVLNVPFLFGLEAQGHIPTIEAMLAENHTWDEIGDKIQWEPKTAREYFEKWYWTRTQERREETIAKIKVCPVLAAAVGMLEHLSQDVPVWTRNEISRIVLFANKLLASKTKMNVK